MDIEAQKRQAAALAVEWVRPGMRLGLGTGSTAKHFVELLAERVRGGLNVVGVPTSETTRADARAAGRAADHARRDARTRHDGRRRRRDRPGPDPDQGRRRRAVARKDRGGGVGPHGGDRRREQMGETLGRFPLPIEVMPFGLGRDPARGRGRGRRGRLPGPDRAAAGQGRPRFRHGRRALDTRCLAAADRRCQNRWPTGCRPFPASSSTVSLSGSRKPSYSLARPALASSSGRDRTSAQDHRESRHHDRSSHCPRPWRSRHRRALPWSRRARRRRRSSEPSAGGGRARHAAPRAQGRASARSIRPIDGVIVASQGRASADQSEPGQGHRRDGADRCARTPRRAGRNCTRRSRAAMRARSPSRSSRTWSPSTRRRSARRSSSRSRRPARRSPSARRRGSTNMPRT